jgi:hypothetical protein
MVVQGVIARERWSKLMRGKIFEGRQQSPQGPARFGRALRRPFRAAVGPEKGKGPPTAIVFLKPGSPLLGQDGLGNGKALSLEMGQHPSAIAAGDLRIGKHGGVHPLQQHIAPGPLGPARCIDMPSGKTDHRAPSGMPKAIPSSRKRASRVISRVMAGAFPRPPQAGRSAPPRPPA